MEEPEAFEPFGIVVKGERADARSQGPGVARMVARREKLVEAEDEFARPGGRNGDGGRALSGQRPDVRRAVEGEAVEVPAVEKRQPAEKPAAQGDRELLREIVEFGKKRG